MSDVHDLVGALRERAKELNCLYEVEKALSDDTRSVRDTLADVVGAIGPGWQHSDMCEACVRIDDDRVCTPGFVETPWQLKAVIFVQDEPVGELRVCYRAFRPDEDEGPFLKEELRLIKSLADRLGHWVLYRKLERMGRKWRELSTEGGDAAGISLRVLIDLIKETDEALYIRIARKMLNHLCSIGIGEAQEMLREIDADWDPLDAGDDEPNVPERKVQTDRWLLETRRPFEVAARFLGADEIVTRVQKWVQADKASQFLKVLDSPRSTLVEVREALRRFHQLAPNGIGLPESTLKSVRVALSQRVLTEQLEFVQAAKSQVTVEFFREILDRVITSDESHGKLGGKASGMLLAHRVLQNEGAVMAGQDAPATSKPASLADIRLPRTWYVASDAVLDFIAFNDLEDVLHQKYKSIDEVRRDYVNIVRLFKNSTFPPALVQGLSAVLDEFDEQPLIVRSSSLLEDRIGSAFSGKYKSLFLPNQGTKQQRLEALSDAVAEVYASMFGPDPIQYRRERGVLEFDEQMGVLIQEVVGRRVGRYFFPAFAGVAFSRNEFRWSPRITREDGLVRLVPGMGTRAVDRTGDDYPVLMVPSKPELRANVAFDEILRYSPRRIDVVNIETNAFETLELTDLLREIDGQYPALAQVFSRVEGGRLVKPVSIMLSDTDEPLVATFDGLRGNNSFVKQIQKMMKILEDSLKCPVDVEFAHDGQHLYLLQCRPQSQSDAAPPAPIPRDIPEADVVFSANRFVSNGNIQNISHIVYVRPEGYAALGSRSDLKAVGHAVRELNKLLPKKQFILMGPGRWGSRGDIKLGVSVTYADISNTAMLIEIARRSGSYVPDVSFGTHFFQDLVEAAIGYLPLYPDDDGIAFNERFLLGAENLLPALLPEFAELADTVHVINVRQATDGRVLRVLLNADLDEAVAHLAEPHQMEPVVVQPTKSVRAAPDQFWRWRRQMAERIAAELDRDRFDVVAIYLFGSVKNATAGPASDIDLLVHDQGSTEQRQELTDWLDGWSRCLDEFNYQRTGYRTGGLLDVHFVTDQDIADRTSFAVKIGAVTDAAQAL